MNYAVLDFETTGHGPNDRIIQIGLALIENGELTETYNQFVNPEVPIPRFITDLTGIRDADVADAPVIEDVLPDLLPRLEGRILVAHHASFDVGFLQRMLDECGYAPFAGPVLDTLDIARIFFPQIASLQLSMLASSLGVEHDRPHQADSDAETTARILLRGIEAMEQTSIMTLNRVAELLDGNAVPAIADLSEWIRLHVAQREEAQAAVERERDAKGFRGFQLALGEWGGEDELDIDARTGELPETFAEMIPGLNAKLAQSFDAYEIREAQTEMMAAVGNSFAEDSHLLVEAGTGTGKSLAYLLPAAYASAKAQQKVVITTHTINLQEQLRTRDLPLLEEVFPVPVRSTVLKGRSHYLCLRKFEGKINGRQFDWVKDDLVAAAQMVVWLEQTQLGEDDDVHLGGRTRDFWKTVSSDADSCLNRACPWFKRCFYHRARHQAQTADLIITNHAMVFTDLIVEHPILPIYQQLVVDEAHHFEEVAVSHLGMNLTYYSGVNALLDMYSNAKSGAIPMLLATVTKEDDKYDVTTVNRLQEAVGEIVELKVGWDRLFENTYAWAFERLEKYASEPSLVVRLKPDAAPGWWGELREELTAWTNSCIRLVESVDQVIRLVKEVEDGYAGQAVVTDAYGAAIGLRELCNKLHTFQLLHDTNQVYWMEASTNYKSKSLQWSMAPIDVSEQLRERIFEAKASVILTSATLSVAQRFEYFIDQFGLDTSAASGRLTTLQLQSPFDYRNNVLLTIPRDFPEIRGAVGEAAFVDKLIESLCDVAKATNGKMLVLFTSNKMLRQVHEGMKERLRKHGIQLFGQGVDSTNRSKLTKLFMDSKAAVLLGTSSFWEGVDIPGEALSVLAIIRLPFQPPNHPLVEAKNDYIKASGKNPFMAYAVPQAVLRFKQGFGRLIRTATDRGAVIVYDRRLIDTYYGKHFLYSLPGPKIEHMHNEYIVERIQTWLENKPEVQG